MRVRGICCWMLMGVLAGASVRLHAADLTKIDRTIGKLPAWQTDTQKYALLVFGPEARSRVWLVIDGPTLYVDRNGNGDLTEPNERIAGQVSDENLYFGVPDLTEGELTHTKLQLGVVKLAPFKKSVVESADMPGLDELLRRDPQAQGYWLSLETAMPGFRGNAPDGRVSQVAISFDQPKLLQFADRPEEAPVLHFRGPWSIGRGGQRRISLGRDNDVALRLTTPGLGDGTSVYTSYEELVPDAVHPVLDVTFPASSPGAEPVSVRYTLTERC
jgi:hypothetical protein